MPNSTIDWRAVAMETDVHAQLGIRVRNWVRRSGAVAENGVNSAEYASLRSCFLLSWVDTFYKKMVHVISRLVLTELYQWAFSATRRCWVFGHSRGPIE